MKIQSLQMDVKLREICRKLLLLVEKTHNWLTIFVESGNHIELTRLVIVATERMLALTRS